MRSLEELEPIAEAIVFAQEFDGELPTDDSDVIALERAAAAATAALAVAEPVPERLQARLSAAGLAHCAERKPAAARQAFQVLAGGAPEPQRRGGFAAFLLGVAAVALVWLGVSMTRGEPTAPSAVELRAELLEDTTTREIAWKVGPSPLSGQVEGDVVWSDERQEGYMKFTGLPPLDEEHRFQLWIFDGTRMSDPVDGGLFAIDSAQGETIVPITARLPVGSAAAFAVTVEKKEGVVVSRREHIVATAGL